MTFDESGRYLHYFEITDEDSDSLNNLSSIRKVYDTTTNKIVTENILAETFTSSIMVESA